MTFMSMGKDRYDRFLERLYFESDQDTERHIDPCRIFAVLGMDEHTVSSIINLLLSIEQIAGPFEDGTISISPKGILAVERTL